MTGIITGDIINSRKIGDQNIWLEPVKAIFNSWGGTPKTWEIYRGDSFQVEIRDAPKLLNEALRIKSCIRSTDKHIDVRMGIGIGEKVFDAARITESNGPAFINSGDAFESIRKYKKNLQIITPWKDFNDELKIMMDLALLLMDKWTRTTAQIIRESIDQPELKQSEIAEKLGIKSQPEISQARKRGGYDEIMAMESYFRRSVEKYLRIA